MTTNDQSRHVATPDDSEFTLTIEDALALYAAAGIPRTPRSIQRYCAKQHLSSRRIEVEFGEKYLITRASVEQHIAYIKEVTPATGRDVSRQVATTVAAENKGDNLRQEPATTDDKPRLVATSDDRYLSLLERENEFLRGEISVKNTQIAELTERGRETNMLVGNLQNLLRPLLHKPNRREEKADDFQSDIPQP